MLIEILKALLVGICAAVPIGPVLMMIIQMTFSKGRGPAFMGGIGSALADTIYAAVGLLALGLIRTFIEAHEAVIMLAGACILGGIGYVMMTRPVAEPVQGRTSWKRAGMACMAKTFTSALSNPSAAVVMMTLLALFGLDGDGRMAPAWLVLVAVFCGEILYWRVVTFALKHIFKHFNPKALKTAGFIAGLAVCIFALALAVKGILSL